MARKSGPPKSETSIDRPTDRLPEPEGSENVNVEISEVYAEVERKLDLKIPPEERAEIAAHLTRVVRYHVGELPSPETLVRYDQAIPGLSKRLIKAYEQNVAWRIEDGRARNEDNRSRFAIMREVIAMQAGARPYALAAFYGVLLLAFGFAYLGYPSAGAAVGVGAAVASAAVFLGRIIGKPPASRKRRSDSDYEE